MKTVATNQRNVLFPRNNQAFTIVELLIVIVVIGILAAITIVAYNGIQNHAKVAAVQSALNQASTALENYKTVSSPTDDYPANLSQLKLPSSTNTAYTYLTIASSKYYCLTATNDTVSYYLSSTNRQAYPGTCPVTNGLIGWWNFNGNTNDMSGNGMNGTLYNAVLVTGQNGTANGAYDFSTGNAYVDLSNAYWSGPLMDSTGTTNDFSLSAWVKMSSYPSQYATIIGQRFQDAANFGVKPSGTMYLRMDDSSFVGSNTAISLNTWHLVTVTFHGTGSSSSTGTYYLDGKQDGSEVLWDGDGTSSQSNTYIGWQNRSGIGADSHFPGAIDGVRVYNRLLTPAEIAALYTAGAQ